MVLSIPVQTGRRMPGEMAVSCLSATAELFAWAIRRCRPDLISPQRPLMSVHFTANAVAGLAVLER